MGRIAPISAPLCAVVVLIGCGGFLSRSPSTRAVVPAVNEVASAIMAGHSGGDIAVFGFREDGDKPTTNTEALDEFLLSALLNAGVPVALGVGVVAPDAAKAPKWQKHGVLPDDFRETPSPRMLSGQVHYESPWVYTTVLLTDRDSGAIVDSWRHRLSERELEGHAGQLVKRRGPQSVEFAVEASPIELELHTVVRHSESGFVEFSELTDGRILEPIDGFQLRFRVQTDCAVYAFLYGSKGGSEVIYESQVAYPGRLYYAPGEEQWQWVRSLDENEVYTLYLVAASSLEDERSDLFSDMGELVSRGQIDRFDGLDLLDGAVANFFGRTESDTVAVLRGDEIERGESENFVFSNGENVDSTPQLLSASPVIVRALSFEVQYE